jgi:hypothetical protein
MIVGVPREVYPGERLVALVPAVLQNADAVWRCEVLRRFDYAGSYRRVCAPAS